MALILLDNLEQAEAVIRRAVTIEQANAPDGVPLARGQATLGVCLLEQGRFDEAEPFLLGAYEKLSDAQDDFYRAWTAKALVRVYEKLGRSEDARRYR